MSKREERVEKPDTGRTQKAWFVSKQQLFQSGDAQETAALLTDKYYLLNKSAR